MIYVGKWLANSRFLTNIKSSLYLQPLKWSSLNIYLGLQKHSLLKKPNCFSSKIYMIAKVEIYSHMHTSNGSENRTGIRQMVL